MNHGAEFGEAKHGLREVLQRQIEYYSMRADIYDDAFRRRGRFDHGERENRAWLLELEEVELRLTGLAPLGDVLELACGTGLWTERLARLATSVHAVDASAIMLDLCAARVRSEKVALRQIDLFTWQPEEQYDFVFFGFWFSHVPRVLARDHWRKVVQSLRPSGRFMFVDHCADRTTFALDEKFRVEGDTAWRMCSDGTQWEIVKVFYSAEEIRKQLSIHSWRSLEIHRTGRFFIYGVGELASPSTGYQS